MTDAVIIAAVPTIAAAVMLWMQQRAAREIRREVREAREKSEAAALILVVALEAKASVSGTASDMAAAVESRRLYNERIARLP